MNEQLSAHTHTHTQISQTIFELFLKFFFMQRSTYFYVRFTSTILEIRKLFSTLIIDVNIVETTNKTLKFAQFLQHHWEMSAIELSNCTLRGEIFSRCEPVSPLV